MFRKEEPIIAVNEVVITIAIIDRFSQKFMEHTEVDTAIVGAGPSAYCCVFWPNQGKKLPSLNGS